jgi:hypothetical protein
MEADKQTQTGIRDSGFGIRTPDPVSGIRDPEADAAALHATNVAVWDIPSAIAAGERFRMKVGAKCEQGCGLADGAFEIHDHEGALAATGTLPGVIWPGTTGLYVSEVELAAPATEGLYTWTVAVPSTALGASPVSEADIPHAAGSASFGIRVVAQPDYLVTIEAVDQADQAPLSGARIVMHPYRAVTDERGVARVRVAKGAYQLFVSQTRYVTFGLPIDVTADVTARAELAVEPVLERN